MNEKQKKLLSEIEKMTDEEFRTLIEKTARNTAGRQEPAPAYDADFQTGDGSD